MPRKEDWRGHCGVYYGAWGNARGMAAYLQATTAVSQAGGDFAPGYDGLSEDICAVQDGCVDRDEHIVNKEGYWCGANKVLAMEEDAFQSRHCMHG